MPEIGLFEAIYSQRQITRYISDPVPREAIEKIIEAATKAPSGGNNQPWEFVVITDRGLISRIGKIYSELWLEARGAQPSHDESPVYRSARYLARHMPEVPAMILVCVDHARGSGSYTPGRPIERGRYASSIWLAVQNLFLAARALGLGTRLTTTHLSREVEIKEILGIPESVETMCLIPLGYPRGRFGPTTRRPAAEVTSYNRWGSRG
jgi:nitroreductase